MVLLETNPHTHKHTKKRKAHFNQIRLTFRNQKEVMRSETFKRMDIFKKWKERCVVCGSTKLRKNDN
jgi:hypothetical protein